MQTVSCVLIQTMFVFFGKTKGGSDGVGGRHVSEQGEERERKVKADSLIQSQLTLSCEYRGRKKLKLHLVKDEQRNEAKRTEGSNKSVFRYNLHYSKLFVFFRVILVAVLIFTFQSTFYWHTAAEQVTTNYHRCQQT